MSLAADALQPFVINGLLALSGRAANTTLSDTLAVRHGAGADLDFDNAKQIVSIDFRDPQYLLGAVAADFCRLSSAAFQSVSVISTQILDKSALPWSMVKFYYAAFYAGHALVRMLGESCTYLDRGQVDRINSIFASIGKAPTFTIDRGLYHCIINPAATAVTCKKARTSTGGSHESFWQIFGNRLRVVGDHILLGPLSGLERQRVFVQLDSLRRIVSGYGAPMYCWLTAVRNDMQYRHSFDVWLPSTIRRQERAQLSRLADQWKIDPMGVDLQMPQASPLVQYVISCSFIVAVCRTMILRIAERSATRGRSFVDFGTLAILRDASA